MHLCVCVLLFPLSVYIIPWPSGVHILYERVSLFLLSQPWIRTDFFPPHTEKEDAGGNIWVARPRCLLVLTSEHFQLSLRTPFRSLWSAQTFLFPAEKCGGKRVLYDSLHLFKSFYVYHHKKEWSTAAAAPAICSFQPYGTVSWIFFLSCLIVDFTCPI